MGVLLQFYKPDVKPLMGKNMFFHFKHLIDHYIFTKKFFYLPVKLIILQALPLPVFQLTEGRTYLPKYLFHSFYSSAS